MRSDRLSGAIVLCAALFMGAPDAATAPAGATWVSLCTASGGEIHILVGEDGLPIEEQGSSGACHATCPLPRKAAGRSAVAGDA